MTTPRGLVEMIGRWFRRAPPPWPASPGLTAAEACAIADATIAGQRSQGGDAGRWRAVPDQRDGVAVWQVVETGLGSGALVTVDAATGRVVTIGRWGLR